MCICLLELICNVIVIYVYMLYIVHIVLSFHISFSIASAIRSRSEIFSAL